MILRGEADEKEKEQKVSLRNPLACQVERGEGGRGRVAQRSAAKEDVCGDAAAAAAARLVSPGQS